MPLLLEVVGLVVEFAAWQLEAAFAVLPSWELLEVVEQWAFAWQVVEEQEE